MDVMLKTKHIIMLSKLVAKLDLKIDFKEKDAMKLGTDFFMDVLRNIHVADAAFYELVGSIAGITPERVAETDVKELIEVLREVVNQVVNFIKSPAGSTT